MYRRGGDSLQGRYHHYRLHPFSVGEVARRGAAISITPGGELPLARMAADSARALLAYGGFPEPFLAQSARTHRRWQIDRLDRFFREDVRDLEALRDLSSIQLLAGLIPERVGSPLSRNALREDLEVSHRGITHWMDVLERLYHVVRIRPFESSKVRSLRKSVRNSRRPIPDLLPGSVEDSLRLPGCARGSPGHDRSRRPRGTCPHLPGRSSVTGRCYV